MNWRVLAALTAACALMACESPSSTFQAAWYLGNPVPQGKNPPPDQEMYVMLVNQSRTLRTVSSVIINQDGEKPDTGWRLKGPFKLEPGYALVRPTRDFCKAAKAGNCKTEKNGKSDPFLTACLLPVYVIVVTAEDRNGIEVRMSGLIPSSLPYKWDRDCRGHK